MFTPAFRRLQAKTQVFQAGEYDFYRTRLTHSLEVSRIAESIAVWLRKQEPAAAIDPDLLEAICLAHDIGHPPFGHAGERALNTLMGNYGGFEGNAQTLRILTRTIYNRREGRGGMSPTRALLDGVLKYEAAASANRGGGLTSIISSTTTRRRSSNSASNTGRTWLPRWTVPRRTISTAFECQIMDLADDIAYSCFDIVDGHKARFITAEKIAAWRDENADLDEPEQAKYLAD